MDKVSTEPIDAVKNGKVGNKGAAAGPTCERTSGSFELDPEKAKAAQGCAFP
ncbi:hypothetical protein GCM10010343_66240 [Streptomyces avidinii]|nr:hypothetical protein GCM10010343_66240 [Streptomyces avidinii]